MKFRYSLAITLTLVLITATATAASHYTTITNNENKMTVKVSYSDNNEISNEIVKSLKGDEAGFYDKTFIITSSGCNLTKSIESITNYNGENIDDNGIYLIRLTYGGDFYSQNVTKKETGESALSTFCDNGGVKPEKISYYDFIIYNYYPGYYTILDPQNIIPYDKNSLVKVDYFFWNTSYYSGAACRIPAYYFDTGYYKNEDFTSEYNLLFSRINCSMPPTDEDVYTDCAPYVDQNKPFKSACEAFGSNNCDFSNKCGSRIEYVGETNYFDETHIMYLTQKTWFAKNYYCKKGWVCEKTGEGQNIIIDSRCCPQEYPSYNEEFDICQK